MPTIDVNDCVEAVEGQVTGGSSTDYFSNTITVTAHYKYGGTTSFNIDAQEGESSSNSTNFGARTVSHIKVSAEYDDDTFYLDYVDVFTSSVTSHQHDI